MVTKQPLTERLRIYGVKDVRLRNIISEFVGTFLLCFVGLCNVAQFHLGHEKTTTWIGVNIGWGFAILFAVQSTARMSGGHLNPAVSFLMWTLDHINPITMLYYWAAQIAGAFFAAMAMYGYYIDAFNAYDKGVRAVLGSTGSGVCFCSYPGAHLTGVMGPWIDQVVGTGVLCYFLCVVIDERNQIPKVWHPTIFSFLVMMIGTAFGMNMGYPINPARDFGPRLFSFFVFGSGVFTTPYSGYFLAPLIAPLIGAVFGGWLYHFTLGIHNPDIIIPVEEKEIPMITIEEKKLLS